MLVALTGTPGTGKSSVSNLLQKKGFKVIDLNELTKQKNISIGFDKKRKTWIINIDQLNYFITEKFSNTKNLILLEGHLSHLLEIVDKILVLRCHPDELRKRLKNKSWNEDKIVENIEAEILDIILCECLEIHLEKNIFEIDTTNKSIESVTHSIMEIIENKFKQIDKYNIGKIDWSEEILKDF